MSKTSTSFARATGYIAHVSPCEPDRSEIVEVEGLRLRRDALVRLRSEHPELSDEQLVAALVSGRRAEAHPGTNKKKS